jgi:hypothetical protein
MGTPRLVLGVPHIPQPPTPDGVLFCAGCVQPRDLWPPLWPWLTEQAAPAVEWIGEARCCWLLLAGIVKTLCEAIAKQCPQAWVAIISNPVNSTVPIAAEVGSTAWRAVRISSLRCSTPQPV